MTGIKCIIADDEHLALTLMEDYIAQLPQLELVASCSNGVEVLNALRQEEVQLLFLDIQMPDLKGTDLVKSLPYTPLVVFTTAYPEYAIESYDLQAVDYLLKPIEFQRFVTAVNKVSDLLRLRNTGVDKDNYLLVKADYGVHKIFHKDILYIEGLQEYVTIYMADGQKLVTLMSLIKLEESLGSEFLRIHRSYIVRKDRVSSLQGNQVVIGNVKIPIGKSYREKTLKSIF